MMTPPRVALESTVIAHGLPYPQNLETARKLEAIVRDAGADPCTIGIIAGKPIVGLSDEQLDHLATAPGVRKVSWRDLSITLARKLDGATTVAATMHLAYRAGIRVFATGGIGGVHRASSGTASFDVSTDLDALARLPMVVVCAGAKAILDLEATREVLETRGVPVIGYGTDEFPAFYSRTSSLPVDVRCDVPETAAAIVQAHWECGLPGSVLVVVPVPEAAALPPDEVEPAIEAALAEAAQRNLRSASVTPFLLAHIAALTGDRALRANLALLENNALVAARIALVLARQSA